MKLLILSIIMSAALYIPLESLAHDGLPKESSNWRWRIINDGVRGDGRTYGLTLDTSGQYNAFSYNHYFTTEKDCWQEIRIPYAEFRAYWFGRKMPMMRITKPGNIRDVGFIISDKKKGPFRLEIGPIGTY